MNPTLLKALVTLVPASMLFSGSSILFFRRKTLSSCLQLLGAGGLVVVVFTHLCEALHLFPWMRWGSEHSVGHYLDLWGSLIEMKRTLLSWSSGKDSAWSLHLLRQQNEYEIVGLRGEPGRYARGTP